MSRGEEDAITSRNGGDKEKSIQTREDFMEGEELCVARVQCMYQEGGVGDKTGGRG